MTNNKFLLTGGALVLVSLLVGLFLGSSIFKGNLSLGGSTQATWTAANLVSEGTVTAATGLTVSAGGATVAGGLTADTGDIRLKSPLFSGSIGSIAQTAGATTSVITAAQVCDSNYATTTPSITEASTLTTPSMVTLVSDCLTTNGDVREFVVLNTTASTTVVTAGASSTLYYDGATGGSATLAASSMAILKFIRTSATTLLITMSQYIP